MDLILALWAFALAGDALATFILAAPAFLIGVGLGLEIQTRRELATYRRRWDAVRRHKV